MNPQELKKYETRLLNKEKALDEREVTLADLRKQVIKREEELANKSLQLKRLEGLIANKENNLREIEANLADTQVSIDNRHQVLESIEESIITQRKEADNKKLQLRHELANLHEDIKNTKASLSKIDKEVAERKTYLNEQEDLVSGVIEKANEQILELKDEIGDLHDQLTSLKSDLVTKTAEKEDEIFSLEEILMTKEAQIERLNGRANMLTEEVEQKQTLLETARQDYNKVREETSRLQAILKEKEVSIITKIDVLRKEREELETDKRRWNSTKSLYDDI